MADRQVNVVYAPISGISFKPLSSAGWLAVGRLEEDTRVEVTPTFCGPAHDLRYLDCKVKITAIDMEARGLPDLIGLRHKSGYLRYNGQKCDVGVFCGSAGFSLEKFRYAFYHDMLPKRGMRWVHQFTGISKDLNWITFLEEGWNAFINTFPPETYERGTSQPNLIIT